MESAALAGLGGRAVGVKAIGSVLGNGLTRNGRLKARTHQFAETTRGNVNYYVTHPIKARSIKGEYGADSESIFIPFRTP